ncbi:hypothetical protein BaRGS_00021191 [Batillaria attramentaria]|uniref:Carbohydrate sulfotransferase n=1 Tax=Batillaria attramentaria TaxID=370345 RepID=A0ABD0KJY8_9CAEN
MGTSGQLVRLFSAKSSQTNEESVQLRLNHLARRDHVQQVCKGHPSTFSVNADISRYFSFSDRHQLVYCSIQKVGCSFWLRAMRILTGQLPAGSFFNGSLLHQQGIRGYNSFLVSGAVSSSTHARDADPRCATNVSFRMFLDTITRNTGTLDGHYSPMYEHCDPCSVDFTYIGKMESFKEDTRYVLQQVGVDLSELSPDVDSFSQDNDVVVVHDLITQAFRTFRSRFQ